MILTFACITLFTDLLKCDRKVRFSSALFYQKWENLLVKQSNIEFIRVNLKIELSVEGKIRKKKRQAHACPTTGINF